MTAHNFDTTNLTRLGATVTYQSLTDTINDYIAATIPEERPAQSSLLQSLALQYSNNLPLEPKKVTKAEWEEQFDTLFDRPSHVIDGICDGKPSNESLKDDGLLYGFKETIFYEAATKDIEKTANINQSSPSEITPSLMHLKGHLTQARDTLNNHFKERFVTYGNAIDHMLEHMNGMIYVTGTDGITRKQFEGLAHAAISRQRPFRDAHGEQFPNFEQDFLNYTQGAYAKALEPNLTVVLRDHTADPLQTSNQIERS